MRRSNIMRHAAWAMLTLCVLLGATSSAHAFTFLNVDYGSPQVGLSTRSRAMGGVGVTLGNGSYSLVDNPGAMTIGEGSTIQLLGSLARVSENRFVPLYDSFDALVVENAISVNDHNYPEIRGGFTIDLKNTGIVLGAGIFTRFDPRYDYSSELRTTDFEDFIVSTLDLQEEGRLSSAQAGVAFRFLEGRLGVGVSANYYFGTYKSAKDSVVFDTGSQQQGVREIDPDATLQQRLERDMSGWSLSVGLVGKLSDRLDLGVALETPPQLTQDAKFSTTGAGTDSTFADKGDLELPLRLQFGGIYHPRNSYRTTFAVDFIYMPWSKLNDGLFDTELIDVWEVRFGLEHVFYNRLPGRIGWRYGESYALEEANRSTFTFGFGYLLDRFRFDLSGEVMKRDSRQQPIVSRAPQGPFIGVGRDRVEDTMLRVTIGVDYTF